MRAFLARLRRDERGIAAVELALILPVIALVAGLSLEMWLQASHQRDAAEALDASVDYYVTGGLNDTEAKAVAMSAWHSRPDDGTVTVARECRCGVTAVACTATCATPVAPGTYVKLTATATLQKMNQPTPYTVNRSLRVQ
jgi:Flp pilus assembly protein TadG